MNGTGRFDLFGSAAWALLILLILFVLPQVLPMIVAELRP